MCPYQNSCEIPVRTNRSPANARAGTFREVANISQGSTLSWEIGVFILIKSCYSSTMPARNSVKLYEIPAYYHVYNRGAGKQLIFRDESDKEAFMAILARHLDPTDTTTRADRLPYEKYLVKLVAYCLMDNHFHLLLYQETEPDAVTRLLRSLSTSYTMYFNKKYRTSGHLFQGIFKASHIGSEAYLTHITRYIHLNPVAYLSYPWSSLGAYLGQPSISWLHPLETMQPHEYGRFLMDELDRNELLSDMNIELGL